MGFMVIKWDVSHNLGEVMGFDTDYDGICATFFCRI